MTSELEPISPTASNALSDPELARVHREEIESRFSRLFRDDAFFAETASDPAIQIGVKYSPFGDALPKRAAISAFLSHKMERKVSPLEQDILRNAYAQRQFGKSSVTDEEFFGLVRGEYEWKEKRKAAVEDLQSMAITRALSDAMAGTETMMAPTFREWAGKYPELVDGKNDSAFLTESFRMYRTVQGEAKRLREPAARVWDQLTRFTQGQADTDDLSTLAREVATIPTEDRQRVYGLVSVAAKQTGQERQWAELLAKNIGESVSRGFDFIPAGVLQGQEAGVLSWLGAVEKNDLPIWVPINGDLSKAVAGNARNQESDAWRLATDEERGKLIDDTRALLPIFQVQRELRAIARNEVDPIKTIAKGGVMETIEGGAYGALGSLAYLGTAAVNPFLTALAYQSNEYDRIRLENPDMDPRAARNIAMVEGVWQAAIDKMQLDTLTGKLPTLGRFLAQVKNNGLRRTLKVAGSVGEQFGQELAQDLGTTTIDVLASVAREDMADKSLPDEIGKYWTDQAPETFVASLIFGLIGGGFASSADFKLNPVDFRKAGFGDKQVQRFSQATSAAELDQLIRDETPNRTPEDIAAGRDLAFQEMALALRIQNDGSTPTIERTALADGSPGFRLVAPDGSEILTTPSAEVATMAVVDEIRAARQRELLGIENEGDTVENARTAAVSEILASANPGWDRVNTTPDVTADQLASELTKLPEPDISKLDGNDFAPLDGPDADRAVSVANDSLRSAGLSIRSVAAGELHASQRTDAANLARAVAGLFGRRVVVFESEAETFPHNAFVNTSPELRDVIFLYNKASRPHMLTLGHELWHHVEVSAPELAAQVRAELEPLIRNRTKIDKEKADYREDRRVAEAIGDFFGDSLADPDFWKGLENRNPSVFRSVASVVQDWLSKVVDALRRLGFGSSQHFNEIERARAVVADALNQFATDPAGRIGPYLPSDPNQNVYSGGAPAKRRTPTREEREQRIEAAIDRMAKNPEERLAVHSRAKRALQELRDKFGAQVSGTPVARGGAEISPEAALEQIEQARAADLADLDADERAEIAEAGREITQSFASRIEAAKTPATRSALEREAKARAVERRKGIEAKFDERRKAINERAREAAADVKEQARQETTRKDRAARIEADQKNMLQAFGTLDAILSLLPAEVRGKAGGFSNLAKMKTPASRARALAEGIERAAAVYEEFLQGEYRERIADLLESAKPKTSESSMQSSTLGPEAQAEVDLIASVVGLGETETAARLDELTAEIDKETDPEALSMLVREWGILNGFGDLASKSAEELATAFQTIQDIVQGGRERWRIQEEARLAEIKEWRGRVQAAARRRPVYNRDIDAARKANQKAFGRLHGYFLSLLDFSQVLGEIAMDPDAPVMRELANLHRRGKNAFEDRMASLQTDYRETLPRLLGVDSINAALARMHRMEAENMPGVTFMEGIVESVERLGVETVRLALQGQAPGLDLSRADLDALRQALAENDAKPAHRQKQFLEWTRRTYGGERIETPMTEMEAVNYLMGWRQPDVRKKLERIGIDETTISEIEAAISPEARAVMGYLSDFYDRQYSRINAVYRRMYGMDLPRVEFYAPSAFDTPKAIQNGVGLFDDLAGQSGLTAGFAKVRTRHGWRFKQRSALNAFWSHVYNSEYWITHAETARMMRGIFGDRTTREAIEAGAGTPALHALDQWLKVHEKNGIVGSGLGEYLDTMMRNMFRRYAMMILGYKVSTNLLNFTAAFTSSIEIGVVPWAKGIARLATGNLTTRLGDVWNSNTIQRRIINGFSPEVRLAMQAVREKPSRLLQMAETGINWLSLTDAVFTTASASIAFDYHYREARKVMPEDQARAVAMDQMDRVIAKTAQPASAMDKSLIENNNAPAYGFAFLFASEARQKAAIGLLGLKRAIEGRGDKGENIRRFAVAWIMLPIMAEIIRSAFNSLVDDEDEGLTPEKLAITAVAGQSTGVLVWGQLANTLASLMLGEWWANRSNNPITATVSSAYSELTQGDYDPRNWEDFEDGMRSMQKMIRAAGIFNNQAAAVAAVSNLAVDAARFADRAVASEGEE